MKTYLITFLLFFSFLKIQAQFVGINTNKPLKTFSVNGTVLVDQNASNFGTLDSASLVFGNVPAKIGIASNKLSTGINYNGLDIWTNNMKRLSITDIGYVGIGIASPATSLHVLSGADVSLNSHGFLLLGNEAGSNMALDNNELQVRNAGAAATLYLQANGGKTQIGHAAESYIQLDGTNIQSTNNQGTNELILNGVNGGKIRLGGNADAGNTKLHISSGVEAGLGAANSGYMMIGASTGDNLIFDNNEILARSNGVASTLFLARDGSKVQLGNGAEATGTKLHITSGAEVGLNNAESGYLMMGSQTGGNMVLDANEIQARNNGAASNIYM